MNTKNRAAIVGRVGLAAIGSILVGAACAPSAATNPAPVTATASSGGTSAGGTVAVTAVDYAFQGLPATAAPGTMFTVNNKSTAELHEFVAIKIPDAERRPVSELVRLPEAEVDAIFGNSEPATVILALAQASGMPVVGDGKIAAAGRYAIVCFIPTGADPQEYLRAAQASQSGPPQVAGGAPHAANGMFAEITIR